MSKKLRTITIGIPAFNEESNISYLVNALINQELTSAKVTQIIVVSDGSTDTTVKLTRKIRDPRLKIIDHKRRSGKVSVYNEIVSKANGDILIMLDADVLPNSSYLLEKIVQPFLQNPQLGLASADTMSANPKNFFEQVIADSHEFKKSMYRKLRNGNTVYLCHGRVQAFSRKLYQKMRWPERYPEDAYSYLFCIQQGFTFAFIPETAITFRSPATIADHRSQSVRYMDGKKKLTELFSAQFMHEQYAIPHSLLLRSLLTYIVLKPITTLSYIFITIYIRLTSLVKTSYQQQWQIANTSKKIIQ